MSYLINDDQGLYFNNEQLINESNLQNRGDSMGAKIDEEKLTSEAFLHQLKKRTMQPHYVIQTHQYTKIGVLFDNISRYYQGIFHIYFFKHPQNIKIQILILDENKRMLTVKARQQRLLICKEIFKLSFEKAHLFSKILIDIQTGQIKIQLPLFYATDQQLYEVLGRKSHRNHLYRNLKNLTLQMTSPLMDIYEYTKSLEQTSLTPTMHNFHKLSTIYKYLQMLNVKLIIDDHQGHLDFKEMTEQFEQEKKSIHQILLRKQLHSKNIVTKLKGINLYCDTKEVLPKMNRFQDFALSPRQKDDIKSKILMPFLPKCRNPYDNNFILNHIKIKNPESLQLSKANAGGFSDILMSQLKFWYVFSSTINNQVIANVQQNFSEQTLLRKLVVIKRDKITSNQKSKQKKSKNEHQIEIIKKMKNGLAIFFPKYYVPTNNEQAGKDDIIIDFLPFGNLSEYLKNNELTLSLQTKFHIMFMVVQGLRYLREYNIVHLDLKPSNIMIYCNLLVKIIDFGQAFHPDVCKKNKKSAKDKYQPGFTYPYGCPEIYQKPSHYTSKNDIYSVGIILYQICYGKFPFHFDTEQSEGIYKERRYMHYWFESPQGQLNLGDSQIFHLLNFLIKSCLHENPQDRPELDWIALILRECLDFFYY